MISFSSTKILIIGAGGLGCEILKLLIMSKFKNITIIDMDKIERSNLNRQFLFDNSCIGKYKSEMAVKSILKFRNNDKTLNLKYHIGNIKDTTLFPLDFFNNFDIILNALDNIDARYYINSVCMKLNKPLINSGSEGFIGTVTCHLVGKTPCYACNAKIHKKTIPICTIRNNPETIEHCIAWAKALFEKIFSDNNNNNNNDNNNKQTNVLDDFVIEKIPEFNEKLLENINFLFNVDIENLKNSFNIQIKENENNNKDNNNNNENKNKFNYIKPILNIFDIFNNNKFNFNSLFDYYLNFNKETQNLTKENFSIENYLKIFIISYIKLSNDSLNNNNKILEFNKENNDIINFIFSASNLRANNFSIQTQSKFKIKEIAGNIIPAIASTNNIISSIQVIETIKYILYNKDYKILKSVRFSNDKKISSSSCFKEIKNDNCEICSDFSLNEFKNQKFIKINFNENWTCDELIKKFYEVIKINNNNNNIDVEIGNDVIYMKNNNLDEDEIEVFNNNLTKKLNNFEKFKGKKNVEIKIILNGNEIYNVNLVNDNFKENNNNNENNEIENTELLNKKRNREENKNN